MEGVDMIEKNEVNSNEGNKECESGSENLIFAVLNEENGVENNSSSSGLLSSSPVREVSASDCTSPDGSEVEEKKDLGYENFEKQLSVLPGISNSMSILLT
jgi:hypothetical protein